MSKKKKRGILFYLFWLVGILLIPVLAHSQSIFPNISGKSTLTEWAFMFIVGAAFTVWLILYRRVLERKEAQRETQNKIFINMEKSMLLVTERLKDMDRESGKQQKQLNKHFQYIMEHNNCHLEHGMPTNKYCYE